MPAAPRNLYLRGDTYWGRIKVAGIEYRSSLRTNDGREAGRRLKAWRLKLERAAIGDPDAPTFKAAVVRWATEALPHNVKPASATRYLSSIAQVGIEFDKLRIDEITAARIGQYISGRVGIVTNATIRRDLTALSRLLASCVAWGWIEANPARTFDRSVLRERREPITPPTQEMLDVVLAAAPPAMAAVLRLLDATGMREAEAVGLSGTDVLWMRQQITLTRTKTSRPRTIDWRTPGGDAGPILLSTSQKGTLFPLASGEPYRNFSSNFFQLMRRMTAEHAKAGKTFQTFRVHDLRHGYAIRALRNGWDIYSLSKQLGHTSVKTTEWYLGYLTGAEQQMAQKGAQRS